MKFISSFHHAAPSWVHHIAGYSCYNDGTLRNGIGDEAWR